MSYCYVGFKSKISSLNIGVGKFQAETASIVRKTSSQQFGWKPRVELELDSNAGIILDPNYLRTSVELLGMLQGISEGKVAVWPLKRRP